MYRLIFIRRSLGLQACQTEPGIKVPVYGWLSGPGKATDTELRDQFTDLHRRGIIGLMYNGGHDPATYRRVGAIAQEAGLEFHAWIPTMLQRANPALDISCMP
jgi:hypothetical protein